jgi:CRISPR-associated protein Cas6
VNGEYWQEEPEETRPSVVGDVVDFAFPLRGATLPVDHAWALGSAVAARLAWFADEPQAGLHLVHGAASGNGWISPEDSPEGLICLSRRSRLVLRLPCARLTDAARLAGTRLEVAGHALDLGTPVAHLLSPLTTLYARHVADAPDGDEPAFMASAAAELAALGIVTRRMLCGRAGRFRFPDGPRATRSLLLAGLAFADSQLLQRRGLGAGRGYGFGLFVPHKSLQNPA